MDPEVERELEAQFAQLTESLSQMNATMAGTVESMKSSRNQQTNTTLTNAVQGQARASNEVTTTTTKLDEANKRYDETMDKTMRNLNSAKDNALSSLSQFASALLSTERGFSKYGGAIQSAGDAVFDIGKNFGILGFLVGGAAKAFGTIAGSLAKQADNINNFADTWKKAGAVGGLTNLQLAELARNAGYASQNLEKLAKPIQTLGPAAINLGGTMQEGQKNFMQMINVGPEVQMRYKRLGYELEDLNDMQAEYVKLQRMSGTSFANDPKTQAQLQRNSLEYADNLIKLTAITGQTIDETKKQQEAAAKDYRETVLRVSENARITRLENSTDETEREEGRKLRAIQKSRERLTTGEASVFALFGQNMGDQIRDFVRTGRVNDENIAAVRLGGEELKKLKALVDAGAGEEEIAKQTHILRDKMRENFNENSESFATSINAMGKDAAEQTGKQVLGDSEFITKMGSMAKGMTSGQAAAQATGQVDAAGQPGRDAAADFQAKARILEQEAQKRLDELMLSINPFLGNTGVLEKFAKGIIAVTAGLLAIGGVLAIAGGISGLKAMFSGGDSDGPGPDVDMPGSGRQKLPTGIRKADLLDKRGRVLQGAALDARMKKLSQQQSRSGNEILDALKNAGRNAVEVMKGGAALGIAIGAVGAGIAGATWLISGALSKFADGLKKFDNVNGDNLASVGIGVMGLGVGILAMGAGQVLNVVGALAEALGAKSPLEKAAESLLALQKMNFDLEKIKNNSEAFVAFGTAMAAGGGLTGLGEVVSSISSGIAGLFSNSETETKSQFDSFIEFSHLEVDADRVKENSTSYRMFADAMASFQGMSMLDSLGVINTALAEATVKFFEGEPPIEKFVYFSSLNIDPVRSFLNSLAFNDFASAMSQYKGSAGIIDTLSSLLGGKLGDLLGAEGPVDAFVNFSKIQFGPNGVKNANAFFKFVKSLTLFAGGSSSILSGLSALASSALDVASDVGSTLVDAGKSALDWITGEPSSPTVANKPKNVTMGAQATFNNVDPDLVKRFYSAAADYGKPISVASGFRSDQYQAEIWYRGNVLHEQGIHTPSKPSKPTVVNMGRGPYTVPGRADGKPGPHTRGIAIDMTPSGGHGSFDPYLHKYGLNRPMAKKGDPPHVQKAAYGGIFESAGRGQGGEVMSRLDPNSLLMKLAKTPAERDGDIVSGFEDMGFDIEEIINSDSQMRMMLISKLDRMLNALDEGKSTSKKLLQTAKAK